ncbi:MAG: 4Fe-4S dicluster domain-containing protein [Oscillospiraceae bacterium]|jgi:[FeFe] hydrogenase (group B1/B3)|nr:4Fe-4S dicluster domain-containing protein [Oscillospiraceae bacterium]
MKKFDTKVQHLKYLALREVAKLAWNGTLAREAIGIPERIIPGNQPTMRCCVYKERAIIAERVKLAMGGDRSNPNVIEVIGLACDECPMGGYEVSSACRGCLAHRCEDVCRRGAITFNQKREARIDKTRCVECGQCAKVCPYGAILNYTRPCERSCKAKAIRVGEDKVARIDGGKCVACGACVYQCPWGAIMDKSYILDVVDLLKDAVSGAGRKVYAVVAPSISSQFTYAKLGQVVAGLKRLGFHTVVEAALGADMVAMSESRELAKKGMLLSSCCPAFVSYVRKHFPALETRLSQSLSPAATISRYIKSVDPAAKTVFIGPCTAKKAEYSDTPAAEFVDSTLTFEELQALFDSREIDINALEEDVLDNASYYGRIFARSGGLSDALAQGLRESGLDDFELRAFPCDGIEEFRVALQRLSRNTLDANFIEGMACVGGCIGGAGCLTHGEKNKLEVDKYGREALEKTIGDAVRVLPESVTLGKSGIF